MNILWLGLKRHHSSQRMPEAAKNAGVNLEVEEIPDLSFVTDGNRIGIYKGDVDVLQRYDALFIRAYYPAMYISEMLTIARLFKDAGKMVVDESVTDEGYAISKMHDYLILAKSGIGVPRSYQIFNLADVEHHAIEFGFPCVLKGVHGAQGRHVHCVETVDRLHEMLDAQKKEYEKKGELPQLILQEFLQADEDYRVLVIGYEALPVFVRRRPKPGDFRTNYAITTEGEKEEIVEGVAADLNDFPEFRTIAERAARLLRREFAGVDIRTRNGQPLILEINRQPDFKGFEEATRIDVASALLMYLQGKLAKHAHH